MSKVATGRLNHEKFKAVFENSEACLSKKLVNVLGNKEQLDALLGAYQVHFDRLVPNESMSAYNDEFFGRVHVALSEFVNDQKTNVDDKRTRLVQTLLEYLKTPDFTRHLAAYAKIQGEHIHYISGYDQYEFQYLPPDLNECKEFDCVDTTGALEDDHSTLKSLLGLNDQGHFQTSKHTTKFASDDVCRNPECRARNCGVQSTQQIRRSDEGGALSYQCSKCGWQYYQYKS